MAVPVHVLGALPELHLPSLLVLEVLTVYLILAIQVCDISAVDVVIEHVGATLLVFVDVVVEVVLRCRYQVIDADRVAHRHRLARGWLLHREPTVRMNLGMT